MLPVHGDANSKRVNGEYWHSDVSCDDEPPLGSILYLHTVPPVGGDTMFASIPAAYDALSPEMKQLLEGLTAVHSGEAVYRKMNTILGVDDRGRIFPRATHPVIRTHPVNGRKAIFVNPGFTSHIVELPPEEGHAILEFLYQHATNPVFQVRFRWEPHSIAFWDNRSAQHMALWDYYPHTRSGYRVTVKGNGRSGVVPPGAGPGRLPRSDGTASRRPRRAPTIPAPRWSARPARRGRSASRRSGRRSGRRG